MYLDPTTQKQITNYFLVDEYLNKKRGYAKRVVQRLKEKGITQLPQRTTPITAQYITQLKARILSGDVLLDLPTVFGGSPGPRHGKDLMYAGFWRTVETVLPNKSAWRYLGLAAYQTEWVTKKVGDVKRTVVCETNPKVFGWLTGMYGSFLKKPSPMIIPADIMDVISISTKMFNILDLDLMVQLGNVSQINNLAHKLANECQDTLVVNITSCIGRGCSQLQYDALMPDHLISRLKKEGCKEVKVFSGGYRDRKVPMRYQHLVITKE